MNDNTIPDSHEEHEEHGDYKEYKHAGNGHAPGREVQNENMTGALPALGSMSARDYTHIESPEFEYLIQSLHDVFERDRQIASQPETTRCGICYLHFSVNELRYREEGFYVCSACEHVVNKQYISMLHRQQKL